MKQISKYYYADRGMKFMITTQGTTDPQCRSTFISYPEGVLKVPTEWVDMGYVHEVIANGT
jgi:hypothetical protein